MTSWEASFWRCPLVTQFGDDVVVCPSGQTGKLLRLCRVCVEIGSVNVGPEFQYAAFSEPFFLAIFLTSNALLPSFTESVLRFWVSWSHVNDTVPLRRAWRWEEVARCAVPRCAVCYREFGPWPRGETDDATAAEGAESWRRGKFGQMGSKKLILSHSPVPPCAVSYCPRYRLLRYSMHCVMGQSWR